MTEKELVTKSFGRCCLSKTFIDDFYANFLASSPKLAPMFAHTNMARQKQLLREGISFMIMYYDGAPIGVSKVRRLGESHARGRLNIAPELYQFWLNSLVKTVAQHDKDFSPTLDHAWRTVMSKGIELMKSMYVTAAPIGA